MPEVTKPSNEGVNLISKKLLKKGLVLIEACLFFIKTFNIQFLIVLKIKFWRESKNIKVTAIKASQLGTSQIVEAALK